jgi:hypothetical protein
MYGVAFLSAWMLAAPRFSVWALAGMVTAPNTSAVVANAMLSFLIRPSSFKKLQDCLRRQPQDTLFTVASLRLFGVFRKNMPQFERRAAPFSGA